MTLPTSPRLLLLVVFVCFHDCSSLVIGGIAAATGFAGFVGWAFQGVGPSSNARAILDRSPVEDVPSLNALRVGGGQPKVALYCGAKVRPESYVPLAMEIIEELGEDEGNKDKNAVLILQSPLNMYCFKPATVEKVLAAFPSVTCVAGHSIGGLWAAEFCRDLRDAGQWPQAGLDFFYMGVHGKSLSLEPFQSLPFGKVAWSYATEDVTMQRAAAAGGSVDEEGKAAVGRYISSVREELPSGAAIVEIAGGNHEQYGSYGSPGYAQGLAYEDLPATISEEEQRRLVAAAIAATARPFRESRLRGS